MTTTRVMTVIALLLLFATHASAEEVFYLHTDALGSVVVVTDENANVVERREYEPYGLPITPIADGPGFTGHDMDGESGLVYMQQRYYDPLVGQFLSVDPMAVDGGTAFNFSRYNYAANNPYRYTDPDGREFRSPARFREAVLSDINSQTTEAYAFNEGGSLVSTGARTDGGSGSQVYTDAINAGISADSKIIIGIQDTYVDMAGETQNVDAHGGGITAKSAGGSIVVKISGNNLMTSDSSGNSIVETSADILRHEIVGHAVPQAQGNFDGNAIELDNAARTELGKPLAPSDPTHRTLEQ